MLKTGENISHYKIISAIGAGGMGEVFLAEDTRLDRKVAIKVLPSELSSDEDRLRRFEQEAKATSALNHPNILTVYDIGGYEGSPFIVAELLEGEELRQRLDEGPIPLRKVTEYAQQIVSGLSAAHEKGIVHRDLKPENLFITNDDRVKILDFGLAKLSEPPASAGGQSGNEDATRRALTNPGVVMGTVGYMSPEQVRGHIVDHRSDIFSFGLILYEMITGRRAFQEESLAETMSAIVKEEPPEMSESNPNISPSLERIVRRCLEKKPERRFQSTADLGFALESLSGLSVVSGPAMGAISSPVQSKIVTLVPWIAAGAVLLLLFAALPFIVSYFRRPPTEPAVVRFSVPLPEKATPYFDVETHNLSVSPDGRRLVFVAVSEGQRKLWLRPLGAVTAQVLSGTEGAYSPFWSPDSRYIAFFAGGKLKRIDPSGTSPQTICDLAGELKTTGTWGADGIILYSDGFSNEVQTLYSVTATGGSPTIVSKTNPFHFYWVNFLSDGRHYLLYEWNEQDAAARGIYVASLDSAETKLVLPMPTALTRMEYAAGYLVYARDGSLLAQAFDEKGLRLSGEPLTVVEHLPYFDKTGWAEFSVSESGVLAYMTESPTARLVWLDRGGRETGQVAGVDSYDQLRLSPDGQRLALTIEDSRNGSGDIWIHDLVRNTATRFAFGPGDDNNAVWSPDGHRLAYFSCCEGKSSFYLKDVSDAGKGETPLEPGFQCPVDWSLDGRFILFTQSNPGGNQDLWVLPVQGDDRKPFPFLQTQFNETQARFSPDGRWVAFVSDETGRNEIYVTRFDHPAEKWRVSTGGGRSPSWRRDGREFYFLAADKSLMAVAVKAGDTFESGTPMPLFRNDSIQDNVFDVTADGQRFIMSSSAAQRQTAPFTVVVNWTADLKK